MKRPVPRLAPRLRIVQEGRPVFGPGKADLLHYIAATGSIRSAAQEMGMSYQRAWNLTQEMNALFVEPLVMVARGGGSGGGAVVTSTGQAVLSAYLRMEQACHAATRADWKRLVALLK